MKRMVGTPITLRERDFVNFQKEVGHYEANLVVGSGNNHGYVLTMVERKSRYGLTKILTSKKADYVIDEIKSLIKENNQFFSF